MKNKKIVAADAAYTQASKHYFEVLRTEQEKCEHEFGPTKAHTPDFEYAPVEYFQTCQKCEKYNKVVVE